MRVRIRSPASLNVPPGKVVEAIVFKLEIMNYELGRTKTANIEDPTFNGNSNAKRVPSLQLPTFVSTISTASEASGAEVIRYWLIVVNHCTGRSSRSRDALAPAGAGRGRMRSPIETAADTPATTTGSLMAS